MLRDFRPDDDRPQRAAEAKPVFRQDPDRTQLLEKMTELLRMRGYPAERSLQSLHFLIGQRLSKTLEQQ